MGSFHALFDVCLSCVSFVLKYVVMLDPRPVMLSAILRAETDGKMSRIAIPILRSQR
jgi:hypothetical protein